MNSQSSIPSSWIFMVVHLFSVIFGLVWLSDIFLRPCGIDVTDVLGVFLSAFQEDG